LNTRVCVRRRESVRVCDVDEGGTKKENENERKREQD